MTKAEQPVGYGGVERRKSARTNHTARPPEAVRRDLELLMDEALEESFPASDPPAWGSAAARLRRLSADQSG